MTSRKRVSADGHTRYLARRLFAALCVAACLLPWNSPVAQGHETAQAPDPAGRLDDVQTKLDQAREGLGTIERQQGATIEDLRRLQDEQAALQTQLQQRQAELADAQAQLTQAEADVAETTTQLDATRVRLERTRARLDRHRQRFAARARESYKHGGAGLLEAALSIEDAAELSRGLRYVEAVLDADREQVELIAGLERQVSQAAEELSALLVRQAAAERVATAQRDGVAELLASTEALLTSVAAKAQEKSRVLAQLEQDQGSYERLVASLEAESASLEEELRRRAEAAAAEEARQAAAAEEARQRRADSPADRGGAEVRTASRFQRPCDGPVTSSFGYRTHPIFGTRRLHAGMDFGSPTGSPIYAADDGVVVSAGWRGGYGLATVIDHGGGLTTLYGHQSALDVRAGERVRRGEVIGRVGSTGYSTGPHLHFEVRVYGSPVNPRGYL